MREILFKAKCVDGGNWVYGDLIHRPYGTTIGVVEDDGLHELYVDENTICQYTGLVDKNGRKIWENDIILACVVGHRNIKRHELMVKWSSENSAGFGLVNKFGDVYRIPGMNIPDFEIIGNAFDNPELLKGGAG